MGAPLARTAHRQIARSPRTSELFVGPRSRTEVPGRFSTPLHADDRILVEAAQAGDPDAFEELVRRYQGRVHRIALRILGSAADAEDVTQDTFVRAWRSLPRFRQDSAVATWLYRIATRRSIDLLAARPRTAEFEPDRYAAGADPSSTAEQRERVRAIARRIQALPHDQRAALVLREFEGLSYVQVARALDTTVPAVKGRIHRARLAVLKETTGWR